jgi:membrane-associated protease RseP (regulator of RpoE activity)
MTVGEYSACGVEVGVLVMTAGLVGVKDGVLVATAGLVGLEDFLHPNGTEINSARTSRTIDFFMSTPLPVTPLLVGVVQIIAQITYLNERCSCD